MKNLLFVLSLMICSYANEQKVMESMKNYKEVKAQLSQYNQSHGLIKNRSTLKSILKLKHPKYAQEIEKIEKLYEQEIKSSKDAVYLFASSSLDDEVFFNFVIQATFLNYKYGTKVNIVLQGITDKEFEERLLSIKEQFEEYSSGEHFIKNFNRMIAPNAFKRLNIEQVPVYAYAKIEGKAFPKYADFKYLIRGKSSLKKLFEEIKKRDEKYEEYYNSIIN